MRKIVLGVLAGWLALAFQVAAAEGEWMTDLPKAQAKAKAENKLVLVDFTGSDWCPPCKALHKNVFSAAEFKEFAAKNLVLVEVDFPNHKEQSAELKKANRELQRKHNVEAFPTVIVFDPSGKQVLRQEGYPPNTNVKDYVAEIAKLKKSS